MRRFSDRCGERLQPPPGNSGLQSYVDAGRSATNGSNDRTTCLAVETRNGGAALGRRSTVEAQALVMPAIALACAYWRYQRPAFGNPHQSSRGPLHRSTDKAASPVVSASVAASCGNPATCAIGGRASARADCRLTKDKIASAMAPMRTAVVKPRANAADLRFRELSLRFGGTSAPAANSTSSAASRRNRL